MAKNNFDDFLLGPSFDDLDSIHQEAERQLLRNGGGLRKLAKKVKAKLTSKKKKNKLAKAAKSAATSDAQAAEIEKVASTNPKGSQQIGKSTKDTPTKASTNSTKKPGDKLEAPKSKATVNDPGAKKIQTKEKSFGETFKENRKMLGAGKTFMYKGKKYSTNTADDLKKSKSKAAATKAGAVSQEQRAKNNETATKAHNQRLSDAISTYDPNSVRNQGEKARAAYEKEQAVKADSRQNARDARDKKAKYSTNNLESGGVKKKLNKRLRPKY
tara:strand:+ start:25163 stop:25975 length:813 start_codon:yes stop_codon:yes gene_type:complete